MRNIEKRSYSHFINGNNYASIDEIETRRKYKNLSLFVFVFTFLPCILISFSGYDFTKPSKIVFFSFSIAMSVFALACIIYLYVMDFKFTVFKKKYYIFLLYFPYLFIDICCYISTNFTTIEMTNINGEVYLGNNMIYFWLLYLPFFIILFVLSHFMFMKCFNKHSRYRIQHRDLNKSEFVASYYADENKLVPDEKIDPIKVSYVIEEKNIEKITDNEILHRFKNFITCIDVFAFLGFCLYGLFTIENLSIYMTISICVVVNLLNIISIVFFILLCILNSKYYVFTKKEYVFLCFFPYLLLDVYCIACSVVNTLYLAMGNFDYFAVELMRLFLFILFWIVFIYSIVSAFTYVRYFDAKKDKNDNDKLEN